MRKLGKPTILAANKAEGLQAGAHLAEFFELGLGEVRAVSAAHGQNIKPLIEEALDKLQLPETVEEDTVDPDVIKLAVAGKPNVGKSTLINVWLGEERLVAFDQPGTTRDAISVPFEKGGQKFELIDTAGIRRKGKVFEAIEKFSVVKTLQAIETAHVVLLLIDAKEGVTDQDAHIAAFCLEAGRALVIAVNKWDAIDGYERELLDRSIESRLVFLKFAEIHKISAIKRQGLAPVWKSIAHAFQSSFRKMPTPQLTRILLQAIEEQAPKREGHRRPKPRYAHQGGQNPPIVVVHGNMLEHITDSWRRYLEGRIRKAFDLVGTPMRIEFRSQDNPFDEK